MRSLMVLTWKEIKQLFLSPIAYAFLIVFLLFVTFRFFRVFFIYEEATLTQFFDLWPWALAFMVPGITMRTWAEERKQGTVEFLLTSPIETWHITLAKFLAGLTLVALAILLTLAVPYTVSLYGDLDPGPVWGGYLGAFLMGGACIAIGMFCSSFTQDQIVSFLVSFLVLFLLSLVGTSFVQTEFGKGSWFGGFLRHISLYTHFDSVGRGVIDLRDVYYFVAIAGLFLYLNVRVIDLRRWR